MLDCETGSRDMSFNAGQVLRVDFNNAADIPMRLAFAADGNIAIAGGTQPDDGMRPAVIEVTPTG